jgi:uncharacterized protein (UPF0212 family)
MRPLSAAELLDVWERGFQLPTTERALALLAQACPELKARELLALPIGRRDAYLLNLRDLLFGPEINVAASCPACGEQLESAFHSADIRADASDPEPIQTMEVSGYQLTFRLLASEDVAAVAPTMGAALARRTLFERCILDVLHEGNAVEAAVLPEYVVAAVAANLAAADPQADVELSLSCPSCAHSWQTAFDIADFLWREIHVWTKDALRGVHVLARAYGWREADVLALTPTRRQIYLELAQQ